MGTIKLMHMGRTDDHPMAQMLIERFEGDVWDNLGDKIEGDELFRELSGLGCRLIAEEFMCDMDGSDDIAFVVEFPDDSVRDQMAAKYLRDEVA